MNYLLIGVVVIIGACAIHGYLKGFIRMAVSLVSLVATIALVTVVSPYISGFLINKTPAYENLKGNVADAFLGGFEGQEEGGSQREKDAVKEQGGAADGRKDPDAKQEEAASDGESGAPGKDGMEGILSPEGRSLFSPADALASLNIPNAMKELLLSQNTGETASSLAAEVFKEYVSSYIARMIINAISFIFAFLVITVAIRMTIFSLNIISRLPIIKGINKTIGLIAGGAEGVLIVWVIFVGALIFLNKEAGQTFFGMVNKSAFLTYLYQTNFLIDFVDGLA